MSATTTFLILIPTALQSWLTVVLLRRGLDRRFRFFFAYTVFSVVVGFLKIGVQGSYTKYFYVYWTTEPFYAILGGGAIFEIFPLVFKTFSRIRRFRFLVFAVVLLMAFLGVLHAVLLPTTLQGPWVRVVYPMEIGVRYIQGGVFVLLSVLASFYGIPLRRYVFGIILGFGLVAASILAAALLRSEFGTRFKFMSIYMPAVVYVLAVLIWLLTFLKPEPPDPLDELKSPLRPEEVIKRLRN